MDQLEWFCQLRNDVTFDMYQLIRRRMAIEQCECNTILNTTQEDKFYVILSGRVAIYLVNKEQQTLISIKKEGQSLGEMTIFSARTKTYLSLICFSQCSFATLTANQYRKFLMRRDLVRIQQKIAQLEKIQFFEPLSRSGKIILLLCMKEIEVNRKQVIYKQEQQAKRVFIIKQGQVKLSIQQDQKSQNLSIIGENELFGGFGEEEYYQETAECDSLKVSLFMIRKKILMKVIQIFGAQEIEQMINQNVKQKRDFRYRLRQHNSVSLYEPNALESTRTIYYSNNTYLSDKILVNANRQVMQTILNRNTLKRPVICIRVK